MMKAKDYFQRAADAERDLAHLRAVWQHYEDIGLSITSRIDAVGGGKGSGGSRVEAAAVGMVDATSRIQLQIQACRKIIEDAEHVISLIPSAKFRQILAFRYLAGWSFGAISDEMGYKDRASVYRAHGFALEKAQLVLDSLK